MNCSHCGTPVVCTTCGAAIDGGRSGVVRLEESVRSATSAGPEPTSTAGERRFLVVARGHTDLLDRLRSVVGDLGWVRPVEDRRAGEALLPREGREGTVHIDREIQP